jgi:hypothetical protein
MRMKPIILATSILATSALLLSGAAHAQAPASPATPPARTAPPAATPPTNCAPMAPHGSGTGTTKDGATVGQSSETLGDRLAKSDGTLCPPAGVDPEIRAPTPEGGKMPVIPPPGSPGGDPSVRPK